MACRYDMTQDVTQGALDDEDLMAQEFAKLRDDRADEPAPSEAVVEAAPVESQEPVAQDEPAAQEPAPAAQAKPEVDPAEHLKQVQAELHKARSEIGRVDALNRKYMQAAQEAAALREQLAQVQQQKNEQQSSASDAASKLEAVAEQVKDFPELAGIVAAVSDALKQADKKTEEVARRVAAQVVEPLEPLRREQTSRIELEQKAAFDAALTEFNSTYPTAVDVVQSDDFKGWLANQPGHIQFAFHKGQTPQEAMSVLDSYDMHLRRAGRESIAQIQTSQPDVQQPTSQKPAINTNRLQRAAGLPSRTAGAQGGQPPADDFDAALAYFRTKRLNAQRAAA